MTHGFHADLTGSNIHIPYTWSYADATEREAASGFVAGDVGKLALQQDNNTLWLLTATTPAWLQITPGAYTGMAGKYVAVKTDESGLEFL